MTNGTTEVQPPTKPIVNLEQQATTLEQQQVDLAAQKVAYQESQEKLAQIQQQYIPKVGKPNIVYERQYQQQFGKTQQQFKQLTSGIESYNIGVEAHKARVEEAKAEIAKLPTTPQTAEDIALAEQLYGKGYISESDVAAYRDVAQKNIAAKEFSEQARTEIEKLSLTPTKPEDITFAESLLGKGYIAEADFLGYKGIAEANIAAEEQARLSMYPNRIKIYTSTYRDRFGATHMRYWSDKAPNGNYAEGSFQITSSKGQVEYTPEQAMEKVISGTSSYLGINRWDIAGQEHTAPPGAIPGESLATAAQKEVAQQAVTAALHARRESLMAGFGGVVTPEMLAPVGTITDPTTYAKSLGATPQDLLKISMLQSPTAQWATVEDFGQKLAEIEGKGFVVPKPAGIILGSTPEQRQAEKMLYEKIGFTLQPESFKSDVFQAELTKLSPEQKQALSFAIEFPKEQTTILKEEDSYKISGLVYNKITGTFDIAPKEEQKEVIWREYTSPDAPLDLKIRNALNEAAANVQSLDVLGGSFEKYIDFVLPFNSKDDVKHQSDYLKAKYGVYERAAAIRESKSLTDFGLFVAESPVLQSSAMMVGFGALQGIGVGTLRAIGMRQAAIAATEKGTGLIFGGLIAKELGTKAFVEGKPGTALAELTLIGATLPFASLGSSAVSKIGEFTPTPKEFLKFVETKASPLGETKTGKFIEAKTEPITSKLPDLKVVRPLERTGGLVEGGITGTANVVDRIISAPSRALEPVREKIEIAKGKITEPIKSFVEAKTPDFVRSLTEPSPIKLMTPSVKAIYESGKLSPQAKAMIESGVKLEYLLKEAKPEQLIPIEFTGARAPKYGERIGEVVKSRLAENPKDVLAGSTSVKAFVPEFREGKPPADWDYYAKNYKETAEYFYKEAKKVYPDAILKENPKVKMFTIEAEGHSVMDIHPLSEYTPIGKIITSGLGKEIPGIKEIETRGVGRKPIKIEEASYMDPVEQLTRKLQGSTKFIARKMVEKPGHILTGREKDVPDFLDIAKSLGRSEVKVHPTKETRITKEVEKFKKAEAYRDPLTGEKMYSGLPVEKYGYEFGKAYGESVKGVIPAPIPLFLKEKETKTEYYDVTGKKSPLEYYPTQEKVVSKLVGDYYPSKPIKVTTKQPSVYYPSGRKKVTPTGYYQPTPPKKGEPGYYQPKPVKEKPPGYYEPPKIKEPGRYYPPPTKYEPPGYYEPYKEKPPVPPIEKKGKPEEFFKLERKPVDERKEYKSKETEAYKYRFRASPIFEYADVLFEGKSISPLASPVKSSRRTKVLTKTKTTPVLDLGLANIENPLETKKYISKKKHNKNVNKK